MKEKIKVLFVEDNQVDQMAFKRFVKHKKLPYDFEICGSVSTAKEALRDKLFDIVLTDHSLGDGTAFELFDDIGDIPLIIVTGSGNEEIAVKAMSAGAVGYLIKDLDSNYLLPLPNIINSAIDHKRNEDALSQYQKNLEKLVRERTGELTKTNKMLRGSEEKYRLLVENMYDIVWQTDLKLVFTYVSPSIKNIFGYTVDEWVGTKLSQHASGKAFFQMARKALYSIKHHKEFDRIVFESEMLRKDGTEIPVEITGKILYNKKGTPIGLQGTTVEITERKQAQENEQQHLQNISFLTGTAMSFVDFPPGKNIYRFIGEQLKELAGESIVVVNSIDEASDILTTQAVLGLGKYSEDISKLVGRNPEGIEFNARDEGLAYLSDGRLHDYEGGLYGIFLEVLPELVCRAIEKLYRLGKIYTIGFVEGKKLFGTAAIFLFQDTELENEEVIETFIKQASIAIQRQLAQVELQRRNIELTLLNRVIAAASMTLEPEVVLETTCRELALAFDLPMTAAALLNEERAASVVAAEYLTDGFSSALDVVIPVKGNPVMQYVFEHKTPLVITDVQEDPRLAVIREELQQRGTASMLILPLMVRGQVVGTLGLDSVERREFSSEEIELAANAVSTAAQALENAQLFSQAKQRLKRIEALHAIDKVISSSVDINLTANLFLKQALTQLEVDAADVLLFDPLNQNLKCIGRIGFRTYALKYTALRLGQGLAGQVALQQEIKHIPDLREEEEAFQASPDLAKEEFIAYYGIPLIAKGVLKGVLEIFHRGLLSPDTEWLMFLKAMAEQAAIAIDNVSMYTDLQRSIIDLNIAYDSTLEGWAKTLELRDRETEGHSQRVVEMTVRLAGSMGLPADQIIHIRRGALLHDIGKMGIPDSILQKPGKLTDDEWEIMRQHTVYAYNSLSGITFLEPALDIPHYHHEQWNGKGYPKGLKGEEIPLAARIFAIVDVWDALRSERPYRKSWSDEKILTHLREQSGKHFDPQVVDAFLKIIKLT
jgi:PAS domain S-box-containing protein